MNGSDGSRSLSHQIQRVQQVQQVHSSQVEAVSRIRDLAMEPADGEVRCNFGHMDPGMDAGTDPGIDVGMDADIDVVLADEQVEVVQMNDDDDVALNDDPVEVVEVEVDHMAMDKAAAVVVLAYLKINNSHKKTQLNEYWNTIRRLASKNIDRNYVAC